MKPKRREKIKWSSDFAYVVGLITADGNLSVDGRHITLVSKDIQLLKVFKKILKLHNKIATKKSGYTGKRDSHYVQFSDVVLYKWLLKIGLVPNKTKHLEKLRIPKKYFLDFVRGYFDGDGSCYSYWDQRWHSSFMFYTKFCSVNKKYLVWLRSTLKELLNINGNLSRTKGRSTYQLRYAKEESKTLFSKMYYRKNVPCLQRKYKKLRSILTIDQLESEKEQRIKISPGGGIGRLASLRRMWL